MNTILRRSAVKYLLVVLVIASLPGCTLAVKRPGHIPNEPRTYQAQYDRVWDAALDTVDEMGFVVAVMNKDDGYISTEMKESVDSRKKVSLRLTRLSEDSVRVSVKSYKENLVTDVDFQYWTEVESEGFLEDEIKRNIASKL